MKNIPRKRTRNRLYVYFLEDMLVSIEKILDYIRQHDAKSFMEDSITQDAVIRNFEIIGEAANNLPNRVKRKYPNIPWEQMYRFRNYLAHEYFGTDLRIVWRIARHQIDEFVEELKLIIDVEREREKLL